jgi:hypothetical protein
MDVIGPVIMCDNGNRSQPFGEWMEDNHPDFKAEAVPAMLVQEYVDSETKRLMAGCGSSITIVDEEE